MIHNHVPFDYCMLGVLGQYISSIWAAWIMEQEFWQGCSNGLAKTLPSLGESVRLSSSCCIKYVINIISVIIILNGSILIDHNSLTTTFSLWQRNRRRTWFLTTRAFLSDSEKTLRLIVGNNLSRKQWQAIHKNRTKVISKVWINSLTFVNNTSRNIIRELQCFSIDPLILGMI